MIFRLNTGADSVPKWAYLFCVLFLLLHLVLTQIPLTDCLLIVCPPCSPPCKPQESKDFCWPVSTLAVGEHRRNHPVDGRTGQGKLQATAWLHFSLKSALRQDLMSQMTPKARSVLFPRGRGKLLNPSVAQRKFLAFQYGRENPVSSS